MFEDSWHEAVERHHPITSKQEIAIHIEVATIVAVHFDTKSFHDLWFVEPFANPIKLTVTERSTGARNTHIVRVLTSPLIRPHDSIVTVDGRWNT